ncbi:hypothetical protein JHS3_27070 [Jeongeupia sp. HS-3]|uniref:hypothetical protein n=1 Tax=Jeongeupia sp. HS-3 TaxID=1009682 RepID=UPI0018A3A320|nr:hypothetical protein [Jeongeupia sp. HS-3]BCL76971.1 hypothetical protein JHS3_27070 [Jeongeupia sp. HS-3]
MNDARRWQRIRAGGFWRCLLLRGALGWGLPFCVLWALIAQMLGLSPMRAALFEALPLGLAAGLVWGFACWGFTLLQLMKSKE